MNSSPIVIISNEKTFKQDENFSCDNMDLKSIPESLGNFRKVIYIAKTSKIKRSHQINLKEIKTASNIFKYIYFVFKTFKVPNAKYLIISITPYTFFSSLILFFFRKKIFVYLRSSGHEEYKFILGSWSVLIYHIMYLVVTSFSNVIVSHERLFDKKKCHVVLPSRLDENWFKNHKKALLDKVRFLYVGRNSPEKGIHNFLKMFNELKFDAEFSIVSEKKKLDIKNNKINLIGYGLGASSLIEMYDSNNIIILPSYTESYGQVIDEALSRKRPVILFEEIEYIIGDRIGIFVSKRNINSFTEIVEFILKNYLNIQESMIKNKLPTREEFISKINNILT